MSIVFFKKLDYDNYFISDEGRILKYENNKNIYPKYVTDQNGYNTIELIKDNVIYYERVDILVAKTFIPNPCNHKCIFHMDGNKKNNNVENLRWSIYDKYWVNKKGKIYKLGVKNPMKSYVDGKNYHKIRLTPFIGKRVNKLVHVLVAQYYLPNPNNLPTVNHKNGNKLDNRVENLEWMSHSDQRKHAIKIGLVKFTNKRAVIGFNVNDKGEKIIVERFDSLAEGHKKDYNRDGIWRAINGVRKTYKGLIWEYENKNISEDNFVEGEIWKKINGFQNYKISNMGRIYNIVTDSFRKLTPDNSGYIRIKLQEQRFYVHILVAQHFIENDNTTKNRVNHKNGNKSDNRVENLEWVTQSENVKHAHDTGLNSTIKPVIQYSIEGDFIKEYPSISEAKKVNNIHSGISEACKNRGSICGGFLWSFTDNPIKKRDIVSGKIKLKGIKKVAIVQYSLQGKKIKEWNSMSEAAKYCGISVSSIRQVFSGVSTKAGNFMWKKIKKGKDIPETIPKYISRQKSVTEYDMEGKKLKSWITISEAAKSVINRIDPKDILLDKEKYNRRVKDISGKISMVCKGKRNSTYDRKWEYK